MIFKLKDLLPLIDDVSIIEIFVSDTYVGQFSAGIISEYVKDILLEARVKTIRWRTECLSISLELNNLSDSKPLDLDDPAHIFEYFNRSESV